MDHKNAATLLEETFEQEFDIDRYASFIKELFNHINISIHDVPLRKEYYKYVDTVNSLGVYRDSDKHSIEVFAIKLKRTSTRDRARTMQRNLIARYLSQFNRDAALVAFYGDDPEDWRFSFVKMEYELTKDEKGNLKVTEELTPAKRHSFLVGKNESNHTCKIQFIGLIKEEDTDPQLVEIEEKFSVENVTKEFFTAYKKLFLDLKESLEEVIETYPLIKKEFEEKNILTTDFSKKLLGQIVFIYFLQKKGWLGVKKQDSWGAGPKNFLRKLFNGEMANYDNFFNEMLEPLFYEALATERDGDYYSRFNCRIPFLNGGLFEPINDYNWIETDITLNNDIFKEILDTFDLFNFTVKEDEPLEKEVAVDPEMLGKVFENLLEIIDRKSKGAFYTPREIVHYMCQQSLINYLDTNLSHLSNADIEKFIVKGNLALDSIIREQEQKKTYHGQVFQKQVLPESIKENSEKINELLMNIKVVDPAVGSGAFPVGMMNEIVKARHIISLLSENEVNNYDLKRETIENSLYGVDIDSSAVDITKLRFWLSLVVDEEEIQNIKPLPNLDHKIMCGNSLIEEFEGINLFDENLLEVPEINPELERINAEKIHLENKLEQLRDQSSKNIDKITEIDNQISKIRKKIKKIISKSNNKSQASLFASEAQKKLKKLKEKHEKFFNAESPNKKKKLRQEIDLIEWEFIEETLKNEGNEKTIVNLEEYRKNKSKPFFLWKLYFSEVFQRKNPGFDVVIGNPPYVEARKIEQEQVNYFRSHYKSAGNRINTFPLFIEKSMTILNDSGTSAMIVHKNSIRSNDYIKLRKYLLDCSTIEKIIAMGAGVFEGVTGEIVILIMKKELNELNRKQNIVLHGDKDTIIDKKLSPYKKISQEIFYQIPGNRFNIYLTEEKIAVLNKIESETHNLSEFAETKQGIIVGNEKEYITRDQITKKHKKILRGRNISRYNLNFNKEYLYYVPGTKVLKRGKTPDLFEKEEKILTQHVSGKIVATLDTDSYYVLQTINLIFARDPTEISNKYLLALLNSKLMNFYYDCYFNMGSEFTTAVATSNLDLLPIKKISFKDQTKFIQKTELLLSLFKEFNNLSGSFKELLINDCGIKLNKKLEKYHELSPEEFLNELKKKKINLISDLNLNQKFNENLLLVEPLLDKIKETDQEIDQMVYELYSLNKDDIKILEDINI